MKTLRFFTEADCSSASLKEAMQLLAEYGEDPKTPWTLIVAPDDLTEMRRLVEYMQEGGEISRGVHVQANYTWDGQWSGRWMVVAQDAVVFSPGAES